MASYRVKDISKATVRLLNAAKVPFALLPEEKCCGSTLIRIGMPDVAKKLAEELVKSVEQVGAKKNSYVMLRLF